MAGIIVTETNKFNIEYSVGDIVKVEQYGDRWADQDRVFENAVFPIKDVPFNAKNEILTTPYDICDEKYKNLEWKVVDVGYFFTEGKWIKETLIIRLRDRLNHEMLFVYDRRDMEHGLKILRKAKNTVNEYNINVN